MVDLKFVDLPGRWHHITIPSRRVNDDLISRGIPFDSSSIVGFRKVSCGDMSLTPDIQTGFDDPFTELRTLSFICNIRESDSRKGIPEDPRSIADRAQKYLKETLDADSLWLPELEFYLLDRAEYGTGNHFSYYDFYSNETDPTEGGFYLPPISGYHASPPLDTCTDIRSEMVRIAEDVGVKVRYHHHELGPFGQNEIEVLECPLLKAADSVMLMKYIIKMTANRYGLVATFLPKPLFNEPGSGMHFHQMPVKNGISLFWDEKSEYARLSETALFYITGLLEHAPSLVAITNPSTNSYKRLVAGFEAPTKRFYGLANRSAAVRIPKYCDTPESKRIEFRPPDGTCNPYLAIAGQLLAGLDGIDKKSDPTEMGFGPFDENIENWPENRKNDIQDIPETLQDALKALSEDNHYLIKNDVFSMELLKKFIDYNNSLISDISRYPHPREIELYFDL